jgi:hypothetical protein
MGACGQPSLQLLLFLRVETPLGRDGADLGWPGESGREVGRIARWSPPPASTTAMTLPEPTIFTRTESLGETAGVK